MMVWLWFAPYSLAQSCQYDVSALSQLKASVSMMTAEGILLENGRSVIISDKLLPMIAAHKRFTFYGLNAVKGTKFWALALLKDEDPQHLIFCADGEELAKGAYPGSKDYDVILGGQNSLDNKGSDPHL